MGEMKCPDGGKCHHGCSEICWRVGCCGPLSGVFPGDEWPEEIQKAHSERDARWKAVARGLARYFFDPPNPYPTDRQWKEIQAALRTGTLEDIERELGIGGKDE